MSSSLLSRLAGAPGAVRVERGTRPCHRLDAFARIVADLSAEPGRPGPAVAAGATLPDLEDLEGLEHLDGHEGAPDATGGPTVEIELLPLGANDHPTAALAGFRAPPHWTVFALSADAHVHDLDRAGPGEAVRVTHVVDVAGRAWTAVDGPGPAGPASWAHPDGLPGRVDDTCRRVLGVPTPAPEHGSEAMFAVFWLAALRADLDAGLLVDPGWRSVAMRHPVFEPILAVDAGPDLEQWAVQRLDRAGQQLAELWTWRALRIGAIAEDLPFGDLEPVVLDWLDDGAFARSVLGELPPVGALLDDVVPRLPDHPAARLLATIDAWGLLDGTGDPLDRSG